MIAVIFQTETERLAETRPTSLRMIQTTFEDGEW